MRANMFFKAEPDPAGERRAGRSAAADDQTSVIGIDLTISGRLRGDADVQVDGRIEGSINTRSVTVTESGHIEGEVFADTVHVGGSVYGPIEAIAVTVAKTARIVGTVVHNRLSVESGATIEGLRPWRPPNYKRMG